jgi:hypothetical protein
LFSPRDAPSLALGGRGTSERGTVVRGSVSWRGGPSFSDAFGGRGTSGRGVIVLRGSLSPRRGLFSGPLSRGEPALGGRGGLTWLSGTLYGAPARLAAMTPRPLNSAGFGVAAIGGRPWFTDASSSRFVPAACSCCLCSEVGGTCRWRAAACCSGVGRAVIPPGPPL